MKIVKNREYKVVKSNALIQNSRHDLSLQEQKILLRIIQMIEPNDTEFKVYEFKISEFCDFCGITYNGKNYLDIQKSLKGLADISYWVENQTSTEIEIDLLRWIDTVKIKEGSGVVAIKLHDMMKPYLLQLKEYFTTYSLYYTIAMKSKYAIRLYELLKSYQNLKEKELNIEKLKYKLMVTHYKKWFDFKRNVIDIAIKEINLLSDINVTYELKKEGKQFISILFFISLKKDIQERLDTWKQIEDRLNPKQIKGQISIINEGINE